MIEQAVITVEKDAPTVHWVAYLSDEGIGDMAVTTDDAEAMFATLASDTRTFHNLAFASTKDAAYEGLREGTE